MQTAERFQVQSEKVLAPKRAAVCASPFGAGSCHSSHVHSHSHRHGGDGPRGKAKGST